MRAFKAYDFTLAANGSQTLLVEGDYFKVFSCTGVVAVSLDGGGNIGPINAGQGMRDQPFKRITVTDRSGAANSGLIIVADSNFVDDRITGEVSVIDGGKVLVMAGSSFAGSLQQGASVGNFSHVQLWNANTVKHIAVPSIWVNSFSATPIFQVRWNTSALTTFGNNPNSKKVNGAASLSELRNDVNAAVLGSSVLTMWGTLNVPIQILMKEPFILPPSTGLLVVNATVNSHIVANYDFYEFTP